MSFVWCYHKSSVATVTIWRPSMHLHCQKGGQHMAPRWQDVCESTAPQETKHIYISAWHSQSVKSNRTNRHNYWLLIPLHSSICRISTGDGRRMIGIDLMVVWVESSLVWWGKHFLLVSRWDGDVLHSKLGRANVLRTWHLGSSVLESEAEQGANHPAMSPELCFRCRANHQQVPHNQRLSKEHLSKSKCPVLQNWTACPDPLSTGPDKSDLPQNHRA